MFLRRSWQCWMAAMLAAVITAGCSSDSSNEQRQREIESSVSAATEAAYAKGRAEAEQAAAEREQQEAAKRAEEAEHAAAQQAAAEQATRDAVNQEKRTIRRNPGKFLVVSDTKVYDKGIVNSYRQLTQLTVLNRSKYALANISGEMDWFGSDDVKIGSTTISLAGSLPAGDTKTLSTSANSLTSSTLAGVATRHVVRFTSAEIVE